MLLPRRVPAPPFAVLDFFQTVLRFCANLLRDRIAAPVAQRDEQFRLGNFEGLRD
jgi:hypothetical protein